MEKPEVNKKALFTAPIDLKRGDEIVLLFDKPLLIRRDGVEIWRNPDLPDYLFETLTDTDEPLRP